MSLIRKLILAVACACAAGLCVPKAHGVENVMLSEVPDYTWYAGCFGTASGNLMGYWDRNGFPDFYTGPSNGGLAPLNSNGANAGIRSLWASKAGFDGRPADKPGHTDDYWTYLNDENSYSYESTEPDPYVLAGRPEHEPDCTGDFMGLSQDKWTDLDGECRGNIDAFSFNFWDKTGLKRMNFTPAAQNNVPMRDIQSGLKAWTKYKGFDADVFSQFVDFNPETPVRTGFTFDDLKAEIDSGYPVLLYLQTPGQYYRDTPPVGTWPGMTHANPEMHGMLAYGYLVTDDGQRLVRFKNSWGSSGDNTFGAWTTDLWFLFLDLKVRGVIGYHPKPKINGITRGNGQLRIQWTGAASKLFDFTTGSADPVSWFVVEKATSVDGQYTEASAAVSDHETLVPDTGEARVFFRVKAVSRPAL